MLQHGIGNFVWASGSGGKVLWQLREIQWWRRKSRKRKETSKGKWIGGSRTGGKVDSRQSRFQVVVEEKRKR